ncbi:hypothetical protein THAOC_01064, partial [Thalassiosira oceanica]
MKRVAAKDPIAIRRIGDFHLNGSLGLEKDETRAFELWSEAAELGSTEALFKIGFAYYRGERGVSQNKAKGVRCWESAAMQGHALSRTKLGLIETENGNHDRALRHYMISAKMGEKLSLDSIKALFIDGNATKVQYAEALKGYQDAVEEMKSPLSVTKLRAKEHLIPIHSHLDGGSASAVAFKQEAWHVRAPEAEHPGERDHERLGVPFLTKGSAERPTQLPSGRLPLLAPQPPLLQGPLEHARELVPDHEQCPRIGRGEAFVGAEHVSDEPDRRGQSVHARRGLDAARDPVRRGLRGSAGHEERAVPREAPGGIGRGRPQRAPGAVRQYRPHGRHGPQLVPPERPRGRATVVGPQTRFPSPQLRPQHQAKEAGAPRRQVERPGHPLRRRDGLEVLRPGNRSGKQRVHVVPRRRAERRRPVRPYEPPRRADEGAGVVEREFRPVG